MVIRRSFSEMNADSAFSIVVLPEPVPPEMIVVTRAFTAAASSSAICGLIAPISTSLFRLNGFLENLRIETSGPSTADRAHGDVDARAIQQARVAERMRLVDARPTAETILLTMRRRCASSLKRQAIGSKHAAALDERAFVAVDQNIVDARVFQQRLERAEAGHLVENLAQRNRPAPAC